MTRGILDVYVSRLSPGNRLYCFLLIVFALFIFSSTRSSIFAATIQSNGTGGGNWNLGTSWNGGSAPLSTDHVIILAGDIINATTNQSCVNLRIDGTLNFNTNSVTVSPSGNLTYSGIGSITGSNAARSLNVTGDFYSLSGANGSISGINLNIGGITDLQGRILFNNTTGSRTFNGDMTINNGGAVDFSAALSIILINNLVMTGTSSLGGTSSATGTLIGVNTFTVSSGANATIGRITMAIVGLSSFSGTTTFNNATGSKTFVGAASINNNGAIEFSVASAAISFTNSLTMNGISSLGGASAQTGVVNVSSNLTISSGALATIGRVTITVASASTIDGGLLINNTNGTKTLGGDVSIGTTGSLTFSAAETVDMGNNLTTSPGSLIGGGGAVGIVNVGSNYSAVTGGTSTITDLTINVVGNFTIPGTAIVNTSGGVSTISVGGNWNITSSNPNPFVEGTSRVTFNGSSGTQSITTTETGGETFYNLTINNTSVTNPGLSTAVNLSARNITYTAGILDLAGRNLTITGDATATTDTYTSGSIITSVAGSIYTVTDPSINKSIIYNGTQIGNATNGITMVVTSSGSAFNGSTFYGNASFTKTGTSVSDCSGGNIFYGPVSFTSIAGADRWRMGNTSGDIFYNATFTHNGNNNFIVARSSVGNEFYGTTTMASSTAGGFYVGRNNNGASGSAVFHGPVILNVTLSGNITFAESSATFQHNQTFESTIQINSSGSSTGDIIFGTAGFGSITLTSTAQFITGSILGATTITMLRITQNGSGLMQTINAGGTSIINCGVSAGNGCIFNGNVNFTSPQIQMRFNTFNGTTNSFTQTGTITNSTFGGNTFGASSSTTFTNQGTGAWRIGNSAADNFIGNVTFVRLGGAGVLEPSYTNNSTYAGNISTVGTTSAITFGNNGGRVTYTGSATKVLSGSSSFAPIFTRFSLNGTGALTLNVPLTVTTNIDFTTGILNTTSTNLVTLNAGSTVTGTPSNASHVDGPIKKIGNTAFTFPTGDGGFGRSIVISAPAVATDAFTAEYFKTAQAFGGVPTYHPSYITVSSCEYWVLDRTTGTSNVTVTLSWNSADCTGAYISDLTSLRVARWNGSAWVDHGNGGTTGSAANGTIVSSAVVTSFSPFTLASTSLANPLPIELVDFSAVPVGEFVNLTWNTRSELNNDFFTVERSNKGDEFDQIGIIQGSGTTSTSHSYGFIDLDPLLNVSYYRLKQSDYDGSTTFSKILKVDRNSPKQLITYPNPAKQSEVISINYKGTFALFNTLGQMVLMINNADQIDTHHLPSGVYTLKTSAGTSTRIVIE